MPREFVRMEHQSRHAGACGHTLFFQRFSIMSRRSRLDVRRHLWKSRLRAQRAGILLVLTIGGWQEACVVDRRGHLRGGPSYRQTVRLRYGGEDLLAPHVAGRPAGAVADWLACGSGLGAHSQNRANPHRSDRVRTRFPGGAHGASAGSSFREPCRLPGQSGIITMWQNILIGLAGWTILARVASSRRHLVAQTRADRSHHLAN